MLDLPEKLAKIKEDDGAEFWFGFWNRLLNRKNKISSSVLKIEKGNSAQERQ